MSCANSECRRCVRLVAVAEQDNAPRESRRRDWRSIVALPMRVGRDLGRAEASLPLAVARGIGRRVGEELDQERGVGQAVERARGRG